LRINWSVDANSGAYDVAIVPKGALENQHLVFPIEQQHRNYATQTMYCNYPMQNELRQHLIAELKEYLSERLPDYMMPQYFTPLEEMPLTPSGKIDRKALPPLETLNITSANTYIEPRNEIEKTLVAIWEKVLKRTGISVTDNFFDIGGHSLRAIRLTSLIKHDLLVEIKLSEIFAHPTIETLAKVIAKIDSHPIVLQTIPQVELHENYDLSNAQRRLWIFHQIEENLSAYNMPLSLRLKGKLNISALEQAFQMLFDRHEVLRTRFITVESEGRQVVDVVFDYELQVQNVANKSQKGIDKLAIAHAARIFDLENEHPLQVELLKVTNAEHILLFNIHHIVSDGWSMGILLGELNSIYTALTNKELVDLPTLLIQYKDYAAWQNGILEEAETIGALKNYWTTQLSDFQTLDLPLDYPRPAIKTYNGANVQYQFSKELTDKLNAYTQAQGATLFMSLTALLNVLFYRYSNQTDIVIGTPSAGRNHADLHHQIGFYLNTLVLRNQIDEAETFEQFLKKVKKTALDAFEHELYPFDRLVEDLDVPRDLSRSVIFDVLLVLQNTEEISLNIGDVEIEPLAIAEEATKFDLNIHFSELEIGLQSTISYNTDIFSAERIERMLEHLAVLMESVCANPLKKVSDLNILPTRERQEVIEDFNNTIAYFPKEKTLADLFEEQVAKTPNHLAVVCNEIQLTYRELDKNANQLAANLIQEHQVKTDDVVGLYLSRSEWIIIAMLGVHKAGAAYLPISLDFPKSRIDFMLNDSKSQILLTDTATFENAKSFEISAKNIETIDYDSLRTNHQSPITNHQSPITKISPTFYIHQVRQDSRKA